jgi:hypothetical protein
MKDGVMMSKFKVNECLVRAGTAMGMMLNDCVNAVNIAANNLAKQQKAESDLASVSSWRFVRAFSSTAHELAESEVAPNTETYVSLCREATEMIAIGMDQVDVLWYFDMKLLNNKQNL